MPEDAATRPTSAGRAACIVAALCLALMLGQVAIMAVPAVIVDLARDWSLGGAEIGWLGGIYFAGYAAGLPFLSGAADRLDGRIVYAIAAAIAGGASLGFALAADGFWPGLGWRFLAGTGFAGMHIVGMKLLADRLSGTAQARAGAVYSAAYAVGSGGSFLVAGLLAAAQGWPAAFLAAGAAALLSLPLVLLVGPPPAGSEVRSRRWLPDFAAALRERAAMRYVLAYAGNTWEVFAIRVWFVPFLAFSAAADGGGGPGGAMGWNPSVLAGIAAIAAVPVSLAVAEAGVRFGRARAVRATALASVAVCLVLAWQAGGPWPVALALLMLHGATSYGDAGAINGGVVAASRPATRSAALALFGLFGFTSGFLGPLAVGLTLDAAGGVADAGAWSRAFVVMALGSAVAAIAVGRGSGR